MSFLLTEVKMFKSVLDYFGTPQDGAGGSNSSSFDAGGASDPLVNNIVDVGGHKVLVKRKIGKLYNC